jgi:hypothetical protein
MRQCFDTVPLMGDHCSQTGTRFADGPMVYHTVGAAPSGELIEVQKRSIPPRVCPCEASPRNLYVRIVVGALWSLSTSRIYLVSL